MVDRRVPNPTYTGWFFIMEIRVRCEEEYLEKTYGEEYAAYKKRTKRYIPFIY